jgi:hypothetical protein
MLYSVSLASKEEQSIQNKAYNIFSMWMEYIIDIFSTDKKPVQDKYVSQKLQYQQDLNHMSGLRVYSDVHTLKKLVARVVHTYPDNFNHVLIDLKPWFDNYQLSGRPFGGVDINAKSGIVFLPTQEVHTRNEIYEVKTVDSQKKYDIKPYFKGRTDKDRVSDLKKSIYDVLHIYIQSKSRKNIKNRK